MYENVLLRRLQDTVNKPLHALQGGFQPRMTSFVLNESLIYSKENHSKLFACFLDARQAFDRVWHDGLFYNLHKLGVCSKLLKSVISMHTDMYSCVMYDGFYSDWFPIIQSTRQGGVWSPFVYLIYINPLI